MISFSLTAQINLSKISSTVDSIKFSNFLQRIIWNMSENVSHRLNISPANIPGWYSGPSLRQEEFCLALTVSSCIFVSLSSRCRLWLAALSAPISMSSLCTSLPCIARAAADDSSSSFSQVLLFDDSAFSTSSSSSAGKLRPGSLNRRLSPRGDCLGDFPSITCGGRLAKSSSSGIHK